VRFLILRVFCDDYFEFYRCSKLFIKMVDFGTNSSEATLALCAGMVADWSFGDRLPLLWEFQPAKVMH
jgi:hypothetical protein